MKRLWALFALGTGLAWHIFSWPVRIFLLRGLARFRQQYVAEGLVPISSHHRARLVEISGCTSCGLCDVVAPSMDPPLSMQVAAFSRSGPDFHHTAADLVALRHGHWQRVERLCPAAIDIRKVEEYVQEGARQMQAAKNG